MGLDQRRRWEIIPAWLITRSACTYSAERDGLNLQTCTETPSFSKVNTSSLREFPKSNSEFPHWTMSSVYPLRRREVRTGWDKIDCTRESNLVEPTVVKTRIQIWTPSDFRLENFNMLLINFRLDHYGLHSLRTGYMAFNLFDPRLLNIHR